MANLAKVRPATTNCRYCGRQIAGNMGQVICQQLCCRREYRHDMIAHKTERRPHLWLVNGKEYSTPELQVKLELEDFDSGTSALRLTDNKQFIIRWASKRRNGRRSLRYYECEKIAS